MKTFKKVFLILFLFFSSFIFNLNVKAQDVTPVGGQLINTPETYNGQIVDTGDIDKDGSTTDSITAAQMDALLKSGNVSLISTKVAGDAGTYTVNIESEPCQENDTTHKVYEVAIRTPDGKSIIKNYTLNTEECSGATHIITGYDSSGHPINVEVNYTGVAMCPSPLSLSCGPCSDTGSYFKTNFKGTCNNHMPSKWGGCSTEAGGSSCQVNCLCCPPGTTRICGDVTSTYDVWASVGGAHDYLNACGQDKFISKRTNPAYKSYLMPDEQADGVCWVVRTKADETQVWACNTLIVTCGVTGCACKTSSATSTPVPPTATPTATPTPVPLTCQQMSAYVGTVNVTSNLSSIKYGDLVIFSATSSKSPITSMTFQVSIDGMVRKTQTVPATLVNGVSTATFSYTVNSYGTTRVRVTEVTP
jgi:hypothetical protein